MKGQLVATQEVYKKSHSSLKYTYLGMLRVDLPYGSSRRWVDQATHGLVHNHLVLYQDKKYQSFLKLSTPIAKKLSLRVQVLHSRIDFVCLGSFNFFVELGVRCPERTVFLFNQNL